MAYIDSTQQHQRVLAFYTRTGKEVTIKGTKPEGIARYRQMVYNVVNDSLSSAYPLARQLVTQEDWEATVNSFFSSHACQSPFLWRMPLEFYEYVKENEQPLLNSYPCLADLLLYEWVEIEVFMMEDEEVEYSTEGNIETDALVLNPACVLQYFQYPVYTKKVTEITSKDLSHYFMLTHRNAKTNVVAFLEIAPMFARMIELLSENVLPIDSLITQFTAESDLTITPDIRKNIVSFFQKCLAKGIILGFVK
jgi:hypothetical protein